MWSSSLGLCLLLTVIHGGDLTDPDPTYMLLVPTLLKAGKEQKFCLDLSHLNESVTATVTLETEQQNTTLLEKRITQSEDNCCVTFVTPETDKEKVGYVTLDAVGDSLHFKSRRSVLIRNLQNLVFFQTDKPIYKPGQKVQFRIVSLDETFHTAPEKFPVIYIEDPQRNRISQWLNVETTRGIAQESFLLASEPQLGTYKLVAQRLKGAQVERTFSVEEYVLPKYDVQVKMPPIITILDQEFKVTVCGKYTYGKPVAGRIDVSVCRSYQHSYSTCTNEEKSVCEELSHQADSNGCFSQVVKTKLFHLKRTEFQMTITATAKITEDGTGVELTGTSSSEIKNTIAKVSFRQLDSHYKRGIPLYGQVFLEDAAGKPISNETVVIYVGYDGTNYTYSTGPYGTADFSINTTSFHQPHIALRVSYKTSESCYSSNSLIATYGEDSRTIQQFYSRSNSYIKIQPIYRVLTCQDDESFTVHYTLSPEGVGETTHAEFYSLVMAKGSIVTSEKHQVKLLSNEESHGQFTFPLPVNVNTAPLAKVLVYLFLENNEVIADSVSFKVDRCFANKVKHSFSVTEALPGSPVELTLSTLPNSLCALRAIDASVLLLKPEAELSAKSVYDLLPLVDMSGYNHDGHYLEEQREDPCIKLEPVFMNGVFYRPSSLDGAIDAYSIFKQLGLKVATNSRIRTPVLCTETLYSYSSPRDYIPMAMAQTSGRPYRPQVLGVPLDIIETVRNFFPETLLWDSVETDDLGHANLKLTVPDSITTWNVGMFCTSEEAGFGLSEPVSLVTFQPFFLDTTLPYSVIRGETFNLKVSVFNYLQQTIRVSISLENSDKFTAKNINTEEEGYCVGVNSRVTVSWHVTLKSLGEVNFTVSAQTLQGGGLCGNEILNLAQGRKDTITKPILVEPEGVEKEETQNAMICGKGSEITEKVSLQLPSRVVEGSARAYFSVIGDVMGTAMQNLGSLLQLPCGCGEQNMVLFTPNIYILEYFNGTNQLTPEIKSKAVSYLTTGYQTQLAYKHADGSYSAFGPRFGDGNTWLTAFVMKSFARAKSHIYIDPQQISDSLLWLSNRQKQNGCFQNVGTLFNNAMKGGVDDEITLAAYITIALLEYPLSVTDVVVRNALFCLETALDGKNSIYTQALMAYAFTLAGRVELRSRLLQSLDEQAIKKDGTVHWHRPEFSDESHKVRVPHRRAPSIEVEMTSYVLLAIMGKTKVTGEDITAATKVVTWLVQQQNPNGGFSSTQDTIVALQALSLYGYHALSHDGPRDISVTLDSAPVAKLHVEDSNRLLLQHVALPSVPGDYSVTVSGSGCVYTQTSLRYNVPHPEGDAPFTITVTTDPETCDIKFLKSFVIVVNVSYVGKRENSNMALVEIKLPSGYMPVKTSVRQLTRHGLIKKTETNPNKVVVYFEKLSKDIQSFKFMVEQDIHVGNLQPATATIMDYYETDDFAVTKYSAPCSSEDDAGNE
ncbi:alpha-2-macroglobulin-like isoform X2 [Mixophyes fleayi]|uniref:alpha-2-macroglobulin-like isoform X2 n=1 Tax=Mixophyes fleayi TaxID=3061075 RepID=UPI003F4E14FE